MASRFSHPSRASLFFYVGAAIFGCALCMVPFLFFAPPNDRTQGVLIVLGNLAVGAITHLIGRWLRSKSRK